VAIAAAPTVKRVTQELGGKSANIILDDANFEKAVKLGVEECFRNTGQSCNAPTRMLVPRSEMPQAVAVEREPAEATKAPRSGLACRPCIQSITSTRVSLRSLDDTAERSDLHFKINPPSTTEWLSSAPIPSSDPHAFCLSTIGE
jgi:acyl-CoA reductase-like NAD-dependent aldehyde dehydrogenase